MLKKLKSYLLDDTLYIGILLVLTSVLSFGLGKFSGIHRSGEVSGMTNVATVRSGIGPQANSDTVPNKSLDTLPIASPGPSVLQLVQTPVMPVQNFVASKSGTKYHAMHCSGSKTIKETNKIFFATEDEAQAAGYTRSANCTFR